jgi:transcription antitermination factor NusG
LLFLEQFCPRLFKIERRVIDKQPFLKFRCQRVHGSEQILSGDAVRMARRRAKKRVQLSEGTNLCKSFNVWPLSITHQLPLIPVGVLCILERVPRGGKCANLAFDFMLVRLAFAPAIIVDLLSNDASGDPSGKQRAAAANEPSGKILVSCHRAAEPFWKLQTRNIHETPGNFGVIGSPSVSKSQSANDNCRQSACESEACEDAVPIHARHATDNGRQPVDNGRQPDCNDDCKRRSTSSSSSNNAFLQNRKQRRDGNAERAAAHLVARGFGIYHPPFDKNVPRCGARATHVERRSLLPGYLFLFVWDLNRHWRRVRACPGVIDLLLDGSGRPAIVAEEIIDYLQAKEFSESGFRNFKRNRRKRRSAQPSDIEDYIVTIKTYSALEGIEQLDHDQRFNLFRKAMGLEQ